VSTYLYRLARWCFRHRRRVLAGWLLAVVVVVVLSVLGHGTEDNNITIPGTESQQVVDLLQAKIPVFSGAQTQVVFASPGSQSVTSQAYAAGIRQAISQMAKVPQVAQVKDPILTKLVSPNGKVALATLLWNTPAATVKDSSLSDLQTAAAPAVQAGLNVQYGGAVYPGWNPKVTETPEVIGIVIALIILLITFGAVTAAVLPILSALIGVVITVTGITALAALFSIATVSTTVAIMLGLSTGIDYGVFILSRHRSQLLAGKPMEESVATAVGTAGSAVVFAGATVIVALCGLSVVGIPFLRTMGLVAAAAVLISVLIALTLLPALLGFAGEKITHFVGPRRRTREKTGRVGHAERIARRSATDPSTAAGAAWGRFVVRFRFPVLIAGIGVALVIAIPALSIDLGLPSAISQPTSSTARQAYDLITDNFGPGYNGPLLVVANPVTSAGDVAGITSRVSQVPDVLSAKPVAFQNDTAVIQVIPKTGPNDSATTNLVNQMRGERTQLSGSPSIDLLVGGTTASNIDVSTKLADALPIFLLVVVGLAFILLTFAFRTILVPITSILGFLLSIAAALGATVAVFQFGWGASLFGAAKSPVTLSYLPTILVAIIFGLSSDYEVFVVSRIKEEFTKHGQARRAVERGTGVSVRVVSAAALIMFTIFCAFTTLNLSAVKPIAVSFAVGVLVDAFLVRLTLIPAAMAIIRAKLWYHPQWFSRYVPDPDIEGTQLEKRLAEERIPAGTPGSAGGGS
jgi:putative drug exporter of the RND superfamily